MDAIATRAPFNILYGSGLFINDVRAGYWPTRRGAWKQRLVERRAVENRPDFRMSHMGVNDQSWHSECCCCCCSPERRWNRRLPVATLEVHANAANRLRLQYLEPIHLISPQQPVACSPESHVGPAVAVEIANGHEVEVGADSAKQLSAKHLKAVHQVQRQHPVTGTAQQHVGAAVAVEVAHPDHAPVHSDSTNHLSSNILEAIEQVERQHAVGRAAEQDSGVAVASEVSDTLNIPVDADGAEKLELYNLESVDEIKREHAICLAAEQHVGAAVAVEISGAHQIKIRTDAPYHLSRQNLCAANQGKRQHSVTAAEQQIRRTIAIEVGNGCQRPVNANCAERLSRLDLRPVHQVLPDQPVAGASEYQVGFAIAIEIPERRRHATKQIRTDREIGDQVAVRGQRKGVVGRGADDIAILGPAVKFVAAVGGGSHRPRTA